ncbi:DoxX family protein [Candidatus Uabimicrobium sp. HlEnr_7]|uniref:DoxX family protein n=1 Tax=Candidatus Uabimicrobium helgolandensis TaxID=3095367 RepID=UPI003558B8E1
MDTIDHWSQVKKITFRFLAALLTLIVFPLPYWNSIAVWFGKNALQISYKINIQPTGSGDTTLGYIQLLLTFIFAVTISIIWSVLDRKRANYNTLSRWFIAICRYYLAMIMLSYGFSKVFRMQFSSLSLSRLIQPFGDASPMGLVWTFMGYSKSYTIFAGLGEVIGGLLLFFRRTTTLGACVVIGVMSNVVMLNFSYDIPVKIYSTQLLVMATVLVTLDLRRFLNYFVFNKPVVPREFVVYFQNIYVERARMICKYVIIAYLIFMHMPNSQTLQKRGDNRIKPLLYGIYDVITFTKNDVEHPPLTTDTTRWQNVVVDYPGYISVRFMNGKIAYYKFMVDEKNKKLSIAKMRTKQEFSWEYDKISEQEVAWKGELEGYSFSIKLKKRDLKSFNLLNRDFNWINEYPFNR